MVARVLVRVKGKYGLVVPRSAVLLRRDDYVVFVRRGDDEIERRVVQTGLNFGKDIQIVTGLSEGEIVITEGAVLFDGELDRHL